MVPRCDNIFWFLPICLLCSKDTRCSLLRTTKNVYTEDIWPSINTDILKSSAVAQTTRLSITPDGIFPYAITGSTLSPKNPDQKQSSAIESSWPSINSDYMTSFPTRCSISSNGIESFPVLTSARFSISPDKTSSLADTTQLSTKYDVTSSSGPDTTVPAPATNCCLQVTGSTYLLLGEDLVLTCSLSNLYPSDYTARDISFRHSCPSQPYSHWECVNQSSVQVIDEKTAKLTISNVTFHDVGQYTCFAGDTLCQFGVEPTHLSLTGFANDVNIEYTPHNVTHFKCVVYNWDEYMNCTWEHPVQYKNCSNVEVTSRYSTSRLDPNMACPKPNDTGCSWDDVPPGAIYTIQVAVTNKPKQQTASTTFTIKAYKNVKPGPIENLTIVPDKTGCLLISWTHPRVYRKVYTIKHKVVGHDQFTILTEDLGNESYISCGYEPYTHHNFSVECLPADVYAGYASDPVFVDVWTPETEPDLGPAATNGSFASTPCTDGLRNVTLMWQAVNETARNGNITGYLITLGQDNLTSTEAGVYSATVVLSCGSVSVAIFAINKAGLSVSPTILLVSTATVSTIVQNSFVVEIKTKEIFHASWDTDGVKGDVEYTIFWCKRRLEQFCEDEIHWREVPAGHTEFVVPVKSSNPEEYIYGISARNVQTGIASQLFWTPCLFTRNPPQPPTINTMNVKTLEDSIYITWSADTCNYQNQVRYTSFVVKWCRTAACHEPGRISNATVRAGESTYTVASLPAGVNYSFTVQPMSYDTPGREVDPWKIAVLSATDQDATLSLAAVLGGLASAAVALVLFATAYTRKNKVKKKLGNTPIVDLSKRIVQELEPHVLELASAHDNQQCPAVTNVNISISLSGESESGIRSISEHGYSPFIREEPEVCNNGQGQGSRQSEPDSPPDAGHMLQASHLSSDGAPHARPPSNGYSRLIGSDSTPEISSDGQDQASGKSEQDSTTDHGYISHPELQFSENTHTRPPSNDYVRVVGNEPEICNNAENHTSSQSEQDSISIVPGYMPQNDLQSSENAHSRPPSNDYIRVVENEPEICNNAENHTSSQSEQDSISIDPGYMPQNDLQSSENAHTRPPSNDYIRIVGNEPEICNNADNHTSSQSEQESTFVDPGYMSLPLLQPSHKALHKGNMYITGTLPQSTVLTMVPSSSDSSVTYNNALFENYSEEEETHGRQIAILSSMDLRDGHITVGVPFEDTLV